MLSTRAASPSSMRAAPTPSRRPASRRSQPRVGSVVSTTAPPRSSSSLSGCPRASRSTSSLASSALTTATTFASSSCLPCRDLCRRPGLEPRLFRGKACLRQHGNRPCREACGRYGRGRLGHDVAILGDEYDDELSRIGREAASMVELVKERSRALEASLKQNLNFSTNSSIGRRTASR